MTSRYRIAIVGAGITGLTLAALLARGRNADALEIVVIDGAGRPAFSISDDIALRVSAIANGSAELLNAAGAWPAVVAARVSPFEAMRVWDENDSPDSASALRFAAAEFAVPQLGYIVENVLVQHALLAVLDNCDVQLRFDSTIDSLPDADLIVGADGARSVVRKLSGIETSKRQYEQTAVVTHLKTERKHAGTARQRFLRDGPLGMLPLADGRISVVWSTTPETAQRALASSDEELGRILTAASDGVLGELTVAGPRGAFSLYAQYAKEYVQPGIALIGDAAHAIHPLAGQGANLGLQDAAELARVLDAAISAGQYPGDRPVLRRYERARKGANLTMLHFMTGLNSLFATNSALLGELRRAGMRLFNRSGPLRERAVKVALGI
ncbi:MAG: FAD-dependent monooxygenase [Gammaproteobacteria bacterium]|nr:FAD-dependent monooxygenase [Gammaproteobacteria bacterium]